MSRRDLITAFRPRKFGRIVGYVETSGAGAWTIDASFNVTSITDNGVGDFTINWTNPMNSANYAVVGCEITTDPRFLWEDTTTAKSTTVARFVNHGATSNLIDPTVGVEIVAVE